MYTLAILIGIFSYTIFSVGILGLLKLKIIIIFFVILFFFLTFLLSKNIKSINYQNYFYFLKPIEIICLVFLGLWLIVNLIGALGPEIFYDALWYHLTLPKLYLQKESVHFIPGNLFYYSAMPRLIEMLYTAVISLSNEIGAKVIHYLFGVLATIVIIIYGSRLFNRRVAIIAALIFYSNLIVAWQSTTAYIDLGRTFFETCAFFLFLNWWKEREDSDLIKSGLTAGLALSTKYLAFGSIATLGLLIVFYSKKNKIFDLFKFLIPALFIPMPWFLFAYLSTGNPIYPLFSGILSGWHDFILRGFFDFFSDFYKLSNLPSDWASPFSPIYLILLPLTFVSVLKFKIVRVIGLYCLLAYIVWFLTPRTGGTRFILPYLPAFSVFVSSVFLLNSNRFKTYKLIAIYSIFAVTIFNLAIRFYVNSKNIPVIIGKQSKHDFLVKNLDFTNAFYDIDHYFEENIKKDDFVLIVGGQNLYYVNFPFTHESFGESASYNYILTQYKNLPESYRGLKPIYQNPITEVKLYKLN